MTHRIIGLTRIVPPIATLAAASIVSAGSDHYYGLPHASLGSASLGQDPLGQLMISNIGSSGQDGVSIDLGRTTGYAIQFDPGPAGALATGSRDVLKTYFATGSTPAEVQLVIEETNGGQAALSLAMSGVSGHCVHVKVFDGATMVDSRTFPLPLPPVLVTGTFGSGPGGSPMTLEVECSGFDLSVFGFQPERVQAAASITGSPTGPVVCDHIEFHVDAMPPDVSRMISSASLLCANKPGGSVTVTGEYMRIRPKGWDGTIKGHMRTTGAAHMTAIGPPDICAGCPECCEPSGGDSMAMMNGVTVTNLGSSGQEGVTFSCRPWGSPWFVSDLRFATSPMDPDDDGDGVAFSSFGTFQGAVGHPLGTCRMQRNAATFSNDLYCNFSSLGSSEVMIECRNDGAFAGAHVTQGGPGVVVGSVRSAGAPMRLTGCGKLGGSSPCYVMEFEAPVMFLSNDGSMMAICDELRLLASAATGEVSTVDSFTVRASGIAGDSFTINQRQCCITDGWQLMSAGLLHSPVGQSIVLSADIDGDGVPELVCDNIGSSGNDGVSIDLDDSEGGSARFAGSGLVLEGLSQVAFDIYDDQCPMCPAGVYGGLELEPSSPSTSALRSKRCPDCPPGHVTLMKREAAPNSFPLSLDELTISSPPGSSLVLQEVGASTSWLTPPHLPIIGQLVIECALTTQPPDPANPGVTVTDPATGSTYTNVDRIVISYCLTDSKGNPVTIDRATVTAAASAVCNPCSFALSRSSLVQDGNTHTGLGEARLVNEECDDGDDDSDDDTLWVANIGSSGQDGVSIRVPVGGIDEDCDGPTDDDVIYGMTVTGVPDNDVIDEMASVRYTAIATLTDGTTSDVTDLTWNRNPSQGSAVVTITGGDLMIAPTVTVTVRDQFGNAVLSASGLAMGDIATVTRAGGPPPPAARDTLIELVVVIAVLASQETALNGVRHEWTWTDPLTFQVPGQPSVQGTTIEVLVEPSSGEPEPVSLTLAGVDVRGTAFVADSFSFGVERQSLIRYTPVAPCPADIAPAPGGNGLVNVQDLLAVIASWGACPAPCSPETCKADIAPSGGNCVVNVQDLLAVIASWGACP